MSKAQIHVWREPIDGATVAVVAMVEFVFRGGYHMASAWTMTAPSDHRWRHVGEVALRKHIDEEHGGRVPWLRRARDETVRKVNDRTV